MANEIMSVEGQLVGMPLAGPESFSQQQLDYLKRALGVDEVTLYEGTDTTTVNAEFNLSEVYTNFERIRVYAARSPSGGHAPYMSEYLVSSTYKRINFHYVAMNDNDTVQNIYAFAGELSGTKLTIKANSTKGVTTSVTNSTSSPLVIVKITGIHRIAGGN